MTSCEQIARKLLALSEEMQRSFDESRFTAGLLSAFGAPAAGQACFRFTEDGREAAALLAGMKDLPEAKSGKDGARVLVCAGPSFVRAAVRSVPAGPWKDLAFSMAELPSMASALREIDPQYARPEMPSSRHTDIAATACVTDFETSLAAPRDEGRKGRAFWRFCRQALFCTIAQRAGIFAPDQFTRAVLDHVDPDGSGAGWFFHDLFLVLDTPEEERGKLPATVSAALRAFPHVGGRFFRLEEPVPEFSGRSFEALVECCRLDWRKLTPDLFQAVDEERAWLMRPGTRIDPPPRMLWPEGGEEDYIRALELTCSLDEKRDSLTFLDPACGCGSFLVSAYRELRRRETRAAADLADREGTTAGLQDITSWQKVSPGQFFGIEKNGKTASLAWMLMHLAQHLMNIEASEELGIRIPPSAAREFDGITCADALEADWKEILPPERCSFLIGRLPSGSAVDKLPLWDDDRFLLLQDREASRPLAAALIEEAGPYIGKMQGSGTRAVFVVEDDFSLWGSVPWKEDELCNLSMSFLSTGLPWPGCGRRRDPAARAGARRAERKVAVVGLEHGFGPKLWRARRRDIASKALYDEERLMDYEIFEHALGIRKKPLSLWPEESPLSAPLMISSGEEGGGPGMTLELPRIVEKSHFRIPVGVRESGPGHRGGAFEVRGAGLWEFGVLSSAMHMAWLEFTGGGGAGWCYRYSPRLAFNTFIWPGEDAERKAAVERTAGEILAAREEYGRPCRGSVETLYWELPRRLLGLHRRLDREVDACYGLDGSVTDGGRVRKLLRLLGEELERRPRPRRVRSVRITCSGGYFCPYAGQELEIHSDGSVFFSEIPGLILPLSPGGEEPPTVSIGRKKAGEILDLIGRYTGKSWGYRTDCGRWTMTAEDFEGNTAAFSGGGEIPCVGDVVIEDFIRERVPIEDMMIF